MRLGVEGSGQGQVGVEPGCLVSGEVERQGGGAEGLAGALDRIGGWLAGIDDGARVVDFVGHQDVHVPLGSLTPWDSYHPEGSRYHPNAPRLL